MTVPKIVTIKEASMQASTHVILLHMLSVRMSLTRPLALTKSMKWLRSLEQDSYKPF